METRIAKREEPDRVNALRKEMSGTRAAGKPDVFRAGFKTYRRHIKLRV